MAVDLSKLSDDDLAALEAGDLTRVSDAGLDILAGGAADEAGQGPETTVGGMLGAGVRGAAPVVAGALAGSVFGPPGIRAGAAIGSAFPVVEAPIISTLSSWTGKPYVSLSQGLQDWLTRLGVPEADTEAEKVAQAFSGGLTAGGGVIELGKMLMQVGRSAGARAAGSMLAAQPGAQMIGTTAAIGAGETTRAMGGGQLAQTGAEFLGGLAGGYPTLQGVVRGSPTYRAAERTAAADLMARPSPELGLPQVAPAVGPRVVPAATPQAEPPRYSAEEIGTLVRDAASGGAGSSKAKEQLAKAAAVNPEAKAAMDRLGFDLPPDVLSDSEYLRQAAGLGRSVVASDPSVAWRETVSRAADRADEVLAQFDVAVAEGRPSAAAVSANVRTTLNNARDTLDKQAGKLYADVDKQISDPTSIDMPNLRAVLATITEEVGEGGLTAQERRLLGMVSGEDGVTYGRLRREKALIGKAIGRQDSPYSDMDSRTLDRLYAALAEDQMAAAEAAGGTALREQLASANLLTAKRKSVEERIVETFGDPNTGDMVQFMRRAVRGASEGKSADFAKLLAAVPTPLQRQTVATAIADAVRSKRGSELGGFGFDEFSKFYRGLKTNQPVYTQIVKVLGPESHQVLRDLANLSERITAARANVLTTGKANQGLIGSMRAESMINTILRGTAARAATAGAAATGGPLAAGATSVLVDSLSRGSKDRLSAAGQLFADRDFQQLMFNQTRNPDINPQMVARVAKGKAFRDYAKATGIPETQYEQFLMNGFQSAAQTAARTGQETERK